VHAPPTRLTDRRGAVQLESNHAANATALAHARAADKADLDMYHWDRKIGTYADWGLHLETMALERIDNGALVRVQGTGEVAYTHVPHFGYVSLFPLLLHRLRTSGPSRQRGTITLPSLIAIVIATAATAPELGALLSKLNRTELLWTEHGLRSLAQNSTLYGRRNTEVCMVVCAWGCVRWKRLMG
jgi:mannosyl-oligosaccharide glucosidase